MNQKEFSQQYRSDTRELVVRIAWCWSKKSAPFPQVDGLCHARARFDQAIDVRTGELMGQGRMNWLEWLTPKRRLGHPYGFAFQVGHLYRLLVREACSNADGAAVSNYYVERMLAADVTEPRLDPYLQFAAAYHEREVERWLLMEGGPLGWANVFGYRRAGVRYVAMAKGETDDPVACNGHIRWMKREGTLAHKTHFDEMCPVELTSALGTFVLNRRYGWFEGTIDYLGNPCTVLLHVVEGSTDGSRALHRLEAICTDLAALDLRARSYAADEMLESACDWCEENLTRDQFMARMDDVSLSVEEDGSIEFDFQDGGMFAGHTIVLQMDADDTFVQADIMG